MLSLKMIRMLSTGSVGPDEIAEVLSSLGIDLEVKHVPADSVPATFQECAIRTLKVGVDVITLSGRMKNGDRRDALMIVQPREEVGVRRIERATYDTLKRFDVAREPEPN
jgi:hypothetical protein